MCSEQVKPFCSCQIRCYTKSMKKRMPDRCRSLTIVICAAAIIGLMQFGPASAADPAVPWECSTYTGDAQLRCMQGLIESQREKIGHLEGQVQAQQSQMGVLQQQLDQQSRSTADLQRQLERPPTVVPAPTPYTYAYPYAYPYPYPLSLCLSAWHSLRTVFRWRSLSSWPRLGLSALGTPLIPMRLGHSTSSLLHPLQVN